MNLIVMPKKDQKGGKSLTVDLTFSIGCVVYVMNEVFHTVSSDLLAAGLTSVYTN